jgi:hypothetical protein
MTLPWNAVAMKQLRGAVSPRQFARIAGVLYLLIFITCPSGASTATPLNIAVTMACDTGVALIFYGLFKPVNRDLAMLALIFRLIFVAIMTLDSLDYFGVIDPVHSAHSARVFDTIDGLSLVPFGAHCLLIGYLIYKSTFLPRFLGVSLAVAGLAYVNFMYAWLVHDVFPYILIPGVIGEGLLTLWLLTVGLNGERWARQASRPGLSLTALT